jgi:hypothetical protein
MRVANRAIGERHREPPYDNCALRKRRDNLPATLMF